MYWLFWLLRKQLDKKAKVNFKIYDIIKGNKISFNKYIARYLKNKMLSDNEIWSVEHVEYIHNFSFKNNSEKEAGRPVSDFFLSFKKVFYEVKASS